MFSRFFSYHFFLNHNNIIDQTFDPPTYQTPTFDSSDVCYPGKLMQTSVNGVLESIIIVSYSGHILYTTESAMFLSF